MACSICAVVSFICSILVNVNLYWLKFNGGGGGGGREGTLGITPSVSR